MWRAKPHSTILPGEKREKATPEGLRRASSSQNKSRQCNGCMKEADVNFKRCLCCKLVFYCSQTCQKRHWSEHQHLCKAIQKEVSQYWDNPKGLGDGADSEVFVSHFTPRKHAALAKLVGQKCSVKCLLNDVDMRVLWDTEAQVFIMPEHVLTSKFPENCLVWILV